jgi:DNA topoisomerase IB
VTAQATLRSITTAQLESDSYATMIGSHPAASSETTDIENMEHGVDETMNTASFELENGKPVLRRSLFGKEVVINTTAPTT